jgi:hypothetical protein
MGGTVLFKATIKAIQLAAQGRMAQGRGTVEKAVIVMSDGHDEGTGYTIDDCIQEAKTRRIPVFTLAIPEEKTRNKYHGNLEKLASATGGVFVPVNDMEQLDAVYNKLDELVKKQYVLTFQLPSGIADGGTHNLEISATHEGTVVNGKAEFRAGFIPPPEPIRDEQLGQIKQLQDELKWREGKLNEFIKERFGTEKIVKELDAREADTLIQSLTKIIAEGQSNDGGNGFSIPLWGWIAIIVVVVALIALLVIAAIIRSRGSKKYSTAGAGGSSPSSPSSDDGDDESSS